MSTHQERRLAALEAAAERLARAAAVTLSWLSAEGPVETPEDVQLELAQAVVAVRMALRGGNHAQAARAHWQRRREQAQ